ncbi:tripartite tricarboxylate transporter substrate binding protein [Verticiella sediminum]|uniref:Tripartite tricarboxylate transporter substrate binding protein n=1 Tax=Verticiella sediminum TaxID=1247510 RepID=A0A556APP9_9BURK|nr:tripartite tricarboxylate transporter substrate binding protein [Verticiella sediminum]TSH94843.1 tripartite tricarboxylate transporter substrate binding protein [Verticiella sediminum]
MRHRQFMAAAAIGLLAAVSHAAQAAYPERTVKVIVSLPPGSGADTTARFIAKHLTQTMGQPFVVENRPGANSFIAARAVAEAPADGYTMFVASNSPMVTNAAVFTSLPYDPMKDFAPVTSIARFPMVLVVPAASAYQRVEDLVAAAKQAPGSLNYGSGTPTYQVAMEQFHALSAIRGTAIHYKGTAPAMTDLAGGNVDYSIGEVSSVTPLINGGRLRALGVASDKRIRELPQTPTIAEQLGQPFEAYAWTGVFFPAGTPEPIVTEISERVRALLESDEGKNFIEGLGGEVFALGPASFRDFQASEIQATRDIVQKAGISVEQ